jgi:hypothetical protein
VLAVAFSLSAGACGNKSSKGMDDAGPGPTFDAGYPASSKARVKFKGNDRLRNEFARMLELDPAIVCTELGLYSCTHLVHQVALGGSEPYGLGLNEPLPFTTITTPLAVDRLALSACRTRVDLDLATPSTALIYKGGLGDAEGDEVAAAIDVLYKQALIRPPSDDEVEDLRQLYRDVEALGAGDTVRDWAIGSCFAVSTTMEQLFY